MQGSQDVIDKSDALNEKNVPDKVAQAAQKYKFLMEKIDGLLDRLQLDA